LYQAYQLYKDDLSAEDFSMLATDIAYFYIEEDCGTEEAAAGLLQQAIQKGMPFAETYYALGLLLYRRNHFNDALALFKTACEYKPIPGYQYNYGVCLYKCGLRAECITLLEAITDSEVITEDGTRALLLLGNLFAIEGKIDLAKRMVEKLIDWNNITPEIEPVDLAELMFRIGEYEKCTSLYETEPLFPAVDWLGLYFYCLKVSGQQGKARIQMDEVIDYLQSMMDETKDCLADTPDLQDEIQDRIAALHNDISDIQKEFHDVFDCDKKPVIDLVPQLAYSCYYINCPRHSDELRL